MVLRAVSDVTRYATSFGYAGTYWDYVQEIAQDRQGLSGLIDLTVSHDEIFSLLKTAGFTGYRLDGAQKWIGKALEMIAGLA